MKILRSPWALAILALVFGLGTQAGVLAWRLGFVGGSHEKHPEASPPPAQVPETLAWSFLTPEIERLRGELHSRLEGVALRERELEDYDNRLKAERAELEKLKVDIEQKRTLLSTSFIAIEAGEQKNLKTLAATYTNLSPAAALAIFKEMDDEMVVKVLSFMKPDPVGQILEEMARTREGEGTLAGRAAVISNKLRLLRQVGADENT